MAGFYPETGDIDPDSVVLKLTLGWEFTLDGTFTEASPLSVDAGVWVPVPNDGSSPGIPNLINYPDGVAEFYDSATQRIFPDAENGFGGVVIALGVKPLAANTELTLRAYIDTPGDFSSDQQINLKADSGVVNSIILNSFFPVIPDAVNDGIRYEVSCNNDCELFAGSLTYVKVAQK